MLFSDQPDNVLLIYGSETLFTAVDGVQRSLDIAFCLATVAVIFARWRAASAPRRRALAPSVAGSLCMLLFVWLMITDFVEGPGRS